MELQQDAVKQTRHSRDDGGELLELVEGCGHGCLMSVVICNELLCVRGCTGVKSKLCISQRLSMAAKRGGAGSTHSAGCCRQSEELRQSGLACMHTTSILHPSVDLLAMSTVLLSNSCCAIHPAANHEVMHPISSEKANLIFCSRLSWWLSEGKEKYRTSRLRLSTRATRLLQ